MKTSPSLTIMAIPNKPRLSSDQLANVSFKFLAHAQLKME
jgi:hypothetical protein